MTRSDSYLVIDVLMSIKKEEKSKKGIYKKRERNGFTSFPA